MITVGAFFLRLVAYFWLAVAGALLGFGGAVYLFMELTR